VAATYAPAPRSAHQTRRCAGTAATATLTSPPDSNATRTSHRSSPAANSAVSVSRIDDPPAVTLSALPALLTKNRVGRPLSHERLINRSLHRLIRFGH
jgi:hypothetical protein